MAVAITVLAESIGSAMGFMFHLLFISKDKDYDPEVAREEIYNLCLTSAIVVTCAYLVVFPMFRAKPPIPPTYYYAIVLTFFHIGNLQP